MAAKKKGTAMAGGKKEATAKKTTTKKPARKKTTYALERLFEDQDEDFVIDCIAPVLAWVPGKSKAKSRQPFEFPVDHTLGNKTHHLTLALTWNVATLAKRVPDVKAHAARLAAKTSPQTRTCDGTCGVRAVARRYLGALSGSARRWVQQWGGPGHSVRPDAQRPSWCGGCRTEPWREERAP